MSWFAQAMTWWGRSTSRCNSGVDAASSILLRASGRPDAPIGALADHLLAAVARLESEPTSGVSFEALVRDALAASAEVVVETSQPDQRIDIGVWSDTLGGSVGNPLLVEIKATLPVGARLTRLIADLAEHVRSSSAQSLLLVYGGSPSEATRRELDDAPLSIMSVPVAQLLRNLRDHSLSEVVESLQADRPSKLRLSART
jgi:hypothetical protein